MAGSLTWLPQHKTGPRDPRPSEWLSSRCALTHEFVGSGGDLRVPAQIQRRMDLYRTFVFRGGMIELAGRQFADIVRMAGT
jgi:hypothetical protein